MLEPYIKTGVVDYTYYPGHRRQIAAYDDCMERHRFDTRWIAFIDLDEFIVPVKDASIPEFLSRFGDFASVEINWLCYGSSGHKEKSPEPVMKRFTRHATSDHLLNRFVKSIVNPRRVCVMTGCHEASRLTGQAADSHGKLITKHFKDREPQHDVIRINHYAVRSLEEFREKQLRGRASGRQANVPMDYFMRYDLNDIDEPLKD